MDNHNRPTIIRVLPIAPLNLTCCTTQQNFIVSKSWIYAEHFCQQCAFLLFIFMWSSSLFKFWWARTFPIYFDVITLALKHWERSTLKTGRPGLPAVHFLWASYSTTRILTRLHLPIQVDGKRSLGLNFEISKTCIRFDCDRQPFSRYSCETWNICLTHTLYNNSAVLGFSVILHDSITLTKVFPEAVQVKKFRSRMVLAQPIRCLESEFNHHP